MWAGAKGRLSIQAWGAEPQSWAISPVIRRHFQMWENRGQLWGRWLENRAEGPFGFKLRYQGPLGLLTSSYWLYHLELASSSLCASVSLASQKGARTGPTSSGCCRVNLVIMQSSGQCWARFTHSRVFHRNTAAGRDTPSVSRMLRLVTHHRAVQFLMH